MKTNDEIGVLVRLVTRVLAPSSSRVDHPSYVSARSSAAAQQGECSAGYRGTPMMLCCCAKLRGMIPSSSSPSVWDKMRCVQYGTGRAWGVRLEGTRKN